MAGLARHLGYGAQESDPSGRGRRLTVARHLAELLHRYSLHRPAMILSWAEGEDGDGAGETLAGDARWQAELWRALRARLGVAAPAERLEEACARLGQPGSVPELPARLALFGLTRLPASELRVLRALAEYREVHLFLLHPSPALWQKLPSPPPVAVYRREDRTAELPANALLASWGRDIREMQLVLTAGHEESTAEHHHPLELQPSTLLEHIQADILGDRQPLGAPLPGEADRRPELASGDRSLQVHSCHGRVRQVEVLRDAILHALSADPTLEPRDVIVMCPDIETFAPLIQATFGPGAMASSPGGTLGVRLADRALTQTNQVLGVIAQLLELAERRLTASEVLGLADREPVRQRFGFGDDDLSTLQDWVSEAGIRWGLDAEHRRPFKLADLDAGTWQTGLDRLLLGASMTETGSGQFAGVLPLEGVESAAIELAGRLAELVARLAETVGAMAEPQPLPAWLGTIAAAADALTATAPGQEWQRAELDRLLAEIAEEAGGQEGAGAIPLTLSEIRAMLGERLQGRPTRANFRTGHLTVCTLYPMRSVPHKVVCLLGLDDGSFPRKAPRDGDDLMLDDPHVGERDPRSEDRQLLLDALMAATDRLIVTYTGNDERSNVPWPPAVPVGELLDTVDATVRTADGPARARVLARHPLQPFDRRNFEPGAAVSERPWSFDQISLAGARSLTLPRIIPAPFLGAPLPRLHRPWLSLDALVRFTQHPARAFLRERLGIARGVREDEVEDALPVELAPLGRWAIGQRLLQARLAGVDGRAAALAEIARGELPPGLLGEPVIVDIYREVEAVLAEALRIAAGQPEGDLLDIEVPLGHGRLLTGTVGGVRGDVLLSATFARVGARQRLASWVRLLAAGAAVPERALSAAVVGRRRDGPGVTVARVGPLAEDAAGRRETARHGLAVVADLYDRGMCEPLPLFCATSAAYAQSVREGGASAVDAAREWASEWNFPKEDREPEHQLVLGGERNFDGAAGGASRRR